MTHLVSKAGLTAAMLLLGGVAGLALLEVARAEPAPAQAAAPRFVYSSGFRGVGYHPNTAARPAPRATAARGSSVGPGVRDWSTGRRGRLHKPWLSSR